MAPRFPWLRAGLLQCHPSAQHKAPAIMCLPGTPAQKQVLAQEHPHTPPAPPCAGPEPESGCRTPVRHGWVSSLTVGLSPASSQSTSTSSLPLLSPSVTLSREIFLQLLALRLPAPIFRGHGSLALSTLLCWVLFLALPARFTHCHLFRVQLRNIPDLLGFVCLRGFACFPKCIIHFDVSKLLLLAPPPF